MYGARSEAPTTADKILSFYSKMDASFALPPSIEIMNPYASLEAIRCVTRFYQRFYGDHQNRRIIFGINPGRFGAGITGVPFTDPIRLANVCAIENNFQKKPELSSLFVYEVINAYGGTDAFYRNFFITALSPLGYTRDGRNLNYYDDKELMKSCEPFIVNSIVEQIRILSPGPVAWCLGEGANFRYFTKLNERYEFFREIRPLPHPRWVMQYRRKELDRFIEIYCQSLQIN